ncbi:odorant receptor 43a-like [Schistocerca piceifrons]|uniref:odorant receptor 43a-like n=1 Tax=Schistocerca piceifrons TaxID=274613 RepID=UPI001F5EB915|nr:odorant receptor 43a-like [Schistocerca piceifrons]
MAFSWSTSGHSVLKLNIRQLCLFGMWPLCDSPLYNFYSALVLTLGVWNCMEGALAIGYSGADLEETTLVLANSFTTCSGLVKGILFVWYRPQYYAMAQRLNALVWAQSEACTTDTTLANILQNSRRRAARISLAMFLFLFLQAVVWFPMPLIAHPGERRLPLVQHYWAGNNSYYELSYIVQCCSANYLANVSFGMDCLLVTIMILVAAQLKVLTIRVAALRMEQADTELGVKQRLEGPPAVYQDRLYKDMCLCIENHQQILRFVKDLQRVMNPIAMTQFIFSVLVACVALFQATYFTSVDSSFCVPQSTDFAAVFQCVAFLPVPGGQVFLYCWAAQNVADEAQAVSTAAYSCSWVESSAAFKHGLRLLLCRAQKRLVLTAGYCYPIDRAAFLSLVNASYSYYALLGQMNRH